MIKCEECKKEFKFLTERHLLKCSGLTSAQYLEKYPGFLLYSEEWKKSVTGENNARYIDGRSIKRRDHLFKCIKCGSGIAGYGKTKMCFMCATKYGRAGKSKLEKEIYEEIIKILPYSEYNKTIKNSTRGFLPDIVILPNIILEVYGDYWHANPEKYKENDVMKRGLLAKEIWESDFIRQQLLEEMGYQVQIIWEKDWKLNKESVLFDIRTSYDWDSCTF